MRIPFIILGSLLLLSSLVVGQTYTISTLAGGGLPVNIPGTTALLGQAPGVAVDANGNVFIASSSLHIVLRLDAATGVLSLVAGNGNAGFSGDNGPATSAQLSFPNRVAVDSNGSVYITDSNGLRIRKVSNGVITTVAGIGTAGYSGDNGPANLAQLRNAVGLAVDSSGNLYIADAGNHRIRKVTSGVITTVAGTGTAGFNGDNGPANLAQLNFPDGIAFDSIGNLYVADASNNRIRRIANGIIMTVAGNGTAGFSGDNGPAISAQVSSVADVAIDSSGNIYISDTANNRIRKVSNGTINTLAGNNGIAGFGGDNGPAIGAQLSGPAAIAVDSSGKVYFADSGNNRIRRVSSGSITTAAGSGTSGPGGDNGPAVGSQLTAVSGIAIDSAINVYITDAQRIRKVFRNVISAVAGIGESGFSGDNGPALAARLNFPFGIALDSAGNLYIADAANNRIRRISNGVINTVAGNGTAGFGGDSGAATSAQLNSPAGIALDAADNLYIADSGNNRIRKVSNGVITTVAGNGTDGSSGDNGPATSAQFQAANVTVDAAGNFYIVDQKHHVIRKVANGVITTAAGNGTPGYSGDNGLAVNAQLFGPTSAAFDSSGSLYIADTTNFRIRKISNGVITTVAGNGTQGVAGENSPATSAQLNLPNGVATDLSGKIYIADGGVRIRVLTPVASSCIATVAPPSLTAPVLGGNLAVSIQIASSCAWSISALPVWITVSGASSGTGAANVTLSVAPNGGEARSASILIAGIPVVVNQAAAAGCVTSISSGGQVFTAAGGSGAFNISAAPGCTWIASSNASWITFVGSSSGTGNGTVSYQVAANTLAARTGSISLAGFSFTIEQVSVSTTEMTSSGAMAQLASAGNWKTTITLVNTGTATAKVRLSFFDDNGNALTLPLTFPQAPLAAGSLFAAVLDRTIDPGATLLIETTGPDAQPVSVGWAQLLSTGSVSGSAVFQQRVAGRVQEATVPLESRNASSYMLSFDNISGSATGIALASISSPANAIGIIIRDDTGALLLSTSISMPALGHTSFDLANNYVVAKSARGTVEFVAPPDGHISVLGLRFNSTGAFTTVLPFVK